MLRELFQALRLANGVGCSTLPVLYRVGTGGPNRAGDDVREAWTAKQGPGRTQEMARLLT
jgi:hypothetical protein